MMLKGWWGMSEERAVRVSVARRRLRVRKLAVDGIGAAGGLVCAFALLRVWQGGSVMELIGAGLVCFCLHVAAVLLRGE
jgi:hypothetical protein